MTTPQAPLHSGHGAKTTAREAIGKRDLSGLTALVTGGHAGIGLETTRVLSDAGATVIVGARTIEKARPALAGIARVEIDALDLFEPASIAFSVHPGAIITELMRSMSDEERRAAVAAAESEVSGLKTVEQGAATTVWCAASTQLDGGRGHRRSRTSRFSRAARRETMGHGPGPGRSPLEQERSLDRRQVQRVTATGSPRADVRLSSMLKVEIDGRTLRVVRAVILPLGVLGSS